MSDQAKPGAFEDSLDVVELVMAIEAALINQNPRLGHVQRERLIREIEALIDQNPRIAQVQPERLIREIEGWIERAEFGDEDDFDDDALSALVRKLGPRTPRGQAGAAAQPEEPF